MSESDDDLFGAEHVRVYRETDGARGYDWRGTTILLLTTKGRVSGEERTTPLIHRTDGDRWIVIASKGGAPEDPDWYKNMQADPHATIQVKGDHTREANEQFALNLLGATNARIADGQAIATVVNDD